MFEIGFEDALLGRPGGLSGNPGGFFCDLLRHGRKVGELSGEMMIKVNKSVRNGRTSIEDGDDIVQLRKKESSFAGKDYLFVYPIVRLFSACFCVT